MTKPVLFKNARIFDGVGPGYLPADVLVCEGRIADVARGISTPREVETIDLSGRVLMPGLIDAHVHVYAWNLDLTRYMDHPPTYVAHFAAKTLKRALDWGFTTVRDCAGADVGLADAITDGHITSPRLFYGGRALSQTGGHGDFRRHGSDSHAFCSCVPHGCGSNWLCRVVDGVDAVRHAVRDELRQGASHIKIMGSGGVASPSDPLDKDQFSDDEIRVAVEECARRGSYVTAHCHPVAATRRCIELGVRCIEHGTFMDDETARFVAERGAYVVPTLSTCFALLEYGEKLGFPSASLRKLEKVAGVALEGVATMSRAGVKLGLGTDLLGNLQVRQCDEFSLRARVQPALEVLRSATAINAEILMQKGLLGCIKPGAHADLLVVDGDPLEDASVLGRQGETLPIVMQAGLFHKRSRL
jgi:imidazolonepropionase-like amidohydrolase